jgi:four helix bundle protein
LPEPEPEPEPIHLPVPPPPSSPTPRFDAERLDVYALAVDFVVLANDLTNQLPRGRSHLADQLHRAATSIPLNIAEGAGEFSNKEKARFYRMAKRSATECAAILDVCSRLGLVEERAADKGRGRLTRIVAMLTRMVKIREEGGGRRGRRGRRRDMGRSSGSGSGSGSGG